MKNKKKWIISGVITGIIAAVAVVVIVLMKKEEKIECPVTGVKLGMSSKEVEKILDKKKIEWHLYDVEEGKSHSISISEWCEFFGEEVSVNYEFYNNKDEVQEIQYSIWYNSVEELEEHEEKITTYYTKKYGKPDEGVGTWDVGYRWHNGDEMIDLFYVADSQDLFLSYYNQDFLDGLPKLEEEEKIECPVTGVKLGMSSTVVENILDKKKIEWYLDDGEDGKSHSISIRNEWCEFFGEEVSVIYEFYNNKDEVQEIQYSIWYNSVEELEEHEEKIKTYYTKKYGKPDEGVRTWDVGYRWHNGDEMIDLFHMADSQYLWLSYYNQDFLDDPPELEE